jgi:hypothetical protein
MMARPKRTEKGVNVESGKRQFLERILADLERMRAQAVEIGEPTLAYLLEIAAREAREELDSGTSAVGRGPTRFQ